MSIPFARTSFPQIYEQFLVGPLFRPFAEAMLDEIAPAAGESLLDVGCGTGVVARLAQPRIGDTGKVTGVDLSPAMVEMARSVAADIDWRAGDATALPLQENERFDVVTCHQGLQFIRDKAAAVREMRRALVDGGRVAVGCWVSDAELPLLLALRRVAERQLGPIADVRHSFGDAGAVQQVLRDAGFANVRCTTVARTLRFADPALFVRLNALALTTLAAGASDMDEKKREEVQAAIERDSVDTVKPYTDAAGLAFELRMNMAVATA